MASPFTLIPRGVFFREGKATRIQPGTNSDSNEGETLQVVHLPTDHYDFAGPLKVEGLTIEEIQWQAAELTGSVKDFSEVLPGQYVMTFNGVKGMKIRGPHFHNFVSQDGQTDYIGDSILVRPIANS